MRGFKPSSLQIFRKQRASVDPSERVDFRFCIAGRTGKMNGILYEYNRKELSIDFWIDKHQRFSSRIAAEEVLRNIGVLQWRVKAAFFGNHDQRIVWMKNLWYRMPLFVRPIFYFVYRYFLRGGFLDGKIGFMYHFMQALWYRMLVDIKIARIRRQMCVGELSVNQLRESVDA